jgi:hypothetical protein
MKFLKLTVFSLFLAGSLVACREQTTEEKAEEMIDEAVEVKEKDDKVKIESPNGDETKIKYDEDGNVEKIKTDDNS